METLTGQEYSNLWGFQRCQKSGESTQRNNSAVAYNIQAEASVNWFAIHKSTVIFTVPETKSIPEVIEDISLFYDYGPNTTFEQP
jgi:hypothetical protein